MSENMQFILMLGILIFIFGAYFAALAMAGWYDKKEREKRGELPMFDERQRLPPAGREPCAVRVDCLPDSVDSAGPAWL